MEKNNHLPFPRKKVTFFYEKETFCPEASGVDFWNCLTMSLQKTKAGCCASGRNDIFLPIQSSKFLKIQNGFFRGDFPLLLLTCTVTLLINVMNTHLAETRRGYSKMAGWVLSPETEVLSFILGFHLRLVLFSFTIHLAPYCTAPVVPSINNYSK